MQNKNDLRIFAKNLRQQLDIQNISKKITESLFYLHEYKKSKYIAAYYPFGSELKIERIFNDNSKNFYLPVLNKTGEMTFHTYNQKDILIVNKYGISEPQTPCVAPKTFDLIILPALMADKKGFRLGYGKGCYDKFLSQHKINAVKIILVPEKLLTENLPVDEFDVCADIIITEERTIVIRNK